MADSSNSSAAEVKRRFGDRISSVGVADLFGRQSGRDHFDAMTTEEQDETFGPTIAAALRAGDIDTTDLVKKAPMASEPDVIVPKSAEDLGLDT